MLLGRIDKNTIYKEKGNGKILGKFFFAFANNPEGAGRPRAGTNLYFKKDGDLQYTMKHYNNNWDLENPPLPFDIEPVLGGGRRKSRRSASRKSRKGRKNRKGTRRH